MPTPALLDLSQVSRQESKLGFPWTRGLYERLLDGSDDAFGEILGRWLRTNKGKELVPGKLRRRNSESNHYEVQDEELWTLYALSRVNDLLLQGFQETPDHPWDGVRVSLAEYWTVFDALGFSLDVRERFSPFHHEIVEVEQSSDPSEKMTLIDVLWPGVMFGNLMFSRAGVRVRGGTDWISKDVAENSVLYFTHRRLRRGVADLSHGWGHNSQWRTSFRRDYDESGTLHYNVDGRWLIGESLPEDEHDSAAVPDETRIEILVHRCAIRGVLDDGDDQRSPFEDRWVETPATEAPGSGAI